MGRKHKHSKDKLYQTVSELSSFHGGANRDLELSVIHRRLRFDSCCLQLNPVKTKPMGLCDGSNYCYVFECDKIIEFLEKYRVHPVTGAEVCLGDLFELKFHKNSESQYQCPVLYKLFNQHSKIVANKKSGHVYLHEAYQELNLKPNYFKDLLTDEPFDKENDIVIVQDPTLAETKWDVANFYYVKKNLKLDDDTNEIRIRDIDRSSVLKSSLDEYRSKADDILSSFNKIVGQTETKPLEVKLDKINSAAYSDGALSSSVTSTIIPSASGQRAALLTEEQILYPRVKKKAYAQILTNFGPINVELYCNRTPKTCHNFLLLASRGYYDDTIFHRLIKNFIIQGGDPTGTGTGGQSAWNLPFRDECHADLKHEGRGVLAMANSGPCTNRSQFYITLKGVWDHLDGKHTVFGRVVGGLETLDRIECEVEVDKKDRPKKDVKILRIVRYVDPFDEAQSSIEEERKRDSCANIGINTKSGIRPSVPAKKFRSGVGSYINLDSDGRKSVSSMKADRQTISGNDDAELDKQAFVSRSGLSDQLSALNPKRCGTGSSFGDFASW